MFFATFGAADVLAPEAHAQICEICQGSTRLLLDHPGNGTIHVGHTEADHDLPRYLPGYSIPGPRNGADPEIQVMRSKHTPWNATNIVQRVVPQRLYLVVLAPGGAGGTVNFELVRVTRMPGIALNMQVEPADESKRARDFFLVDGTGKETEAVSGVTIDAAEEARVLFFCRDYRGECEVRATVFLPDRPPEVHTMEVPQFSTPYAGVPRLPKFWLEQLGTTAEQLGTDDDRDFSVVAVPGEKRGDGIKALDEYGGFFIDGRHWRLNARTTDLGGSDKGGPFIKDVFFVDRSGLYDPATPGDHSIGSLRNRLSRNVHLEPLKLVFHQIRVWEMADRNRGLAPRPTNDPIAGAVDFNGAGKQCTIMLNNEPLRARLAPLGAGDAHGLCPELFVNLRLDSGIVYGHPIIVDRGAIDQFFNSQVVGRFRFRRMEYTHQTAAHELGHILGLVHRLLTLHRATVPLADPQGGFRPLANVSPPAPGFNQDATEITWWGPVEVHGTLVRRLDNFDPATVLGAPVEFTVPGPTSSMTIHLELHQARTYRLTLPGPGLVFFTIGIDGHTGGLMDAIGDVMAKPGSDVSAAEKRQADVQGTKAVIGNPDGVR